MKYNEFVEKKLNEELEHKGWEGMGRTEDGPNWPESGYGYGPGGDPSPRRTPKKKKKDGDEEPKKEPKKFNVGDVIILTDTKDLNRKMPVDAQEFLTTYKTFKVIKVSESGKLDLGCHICKNDMIEGKPVGVEKIYLFSPERFDLKDPAPVSDIKPLEKDDEEEILLGPEDKEEPVESGSPEDKLIDDILGSNDRTSKLSGMGFSEKDIANMSFIKKK